jgi:hypothetical protein
MATVETTIVLVMVISSLIRGATLTFIACRAQCAAGSSLAAACRVFQGSRRAELSLRLARDILDRYATESYFQPDKTASGVERHEYARHAELARRY